MNVVKNYPDFTIFAFCKVYPLHFLNIPSFSFISFIFLHFLCERSKELPGFYHFRVLQGIPFTFSPLPFIFLHFLHFPSFSFISFILEPEKEPEMGPEMEPEMEPKRGPEMEPKRGPEMEPKWGPKWSRKGVPKWSQKGVPFRAPFRAPNRAR